MLKSFNANIIMSVHGKIVNRDLTPKISRHDCPVVCKSQTIPKFTITGDKDIDNMIIEKHGSLEAFLFNKVLDQFNVIARHKHKIIIYEQKISVLENSLNTANSIIEEYEDMY